VQPYYQDDTTTLYHGRWEDVLAAVPLPRVDLVLTDPPYGVNWGDFTALRPCAKTQASAPDHAWSRLVGDETAFDPTPWLGYRQVILWGANCFSDKLPKGRWLVWDKRFKSGKTFKAGHAEAAWMKGGYGIYLYAQTWQGVCSTVTHPTEYGPRGGHPRLHPTQKPVALMQWCLDLAQGTTRRVRTVLDPYCGSGSVLIAAKSRGLQSIGIECEEQYCETTARRLEHTAREEAA
jgi:site-specific DNA-methyltransferase (adenine-specific)